MPMTRAHFSDSYLLDPRHPVTVNVIGAGGTGSQVVTSLARMDTALWKLGHPGLFVRVYDPDTVSESNIGRQLLARRTSDCTRRSASSRGSTAFSAMTAVRDRIRERLRPHQ